MARIVLVTGGSRSGKSAFAQRIAEAEPPPRLYIATSGRPQDAEMAERVRRHQAARGMGWRTAEVTEDLAGVLSSDRAHAVCLVDCLTLWVSNLLLAANGHEFAEEDVVRHGQAVLNASADRSGLAVFVTNEVGMGIVPDTALGRRFRDLAGRCNQTIAAGADEVYLLVSGIPVRIKPGA